VADALESRLFLSAVKLHKPPKTLPIPPVQATTISLNNTSWTPLGPTSISGGPVAGGGAVTGRIDAVVTDPGNANVIYVGAAGGGVWKTTDGGTTWTPLTDAQSTLNIGSLAIAPTNTSIIYAGTGDSTASTQSFYGKGVLKSTDGGATWTLLGNSSFNRRTISRIIVDPTNANTVYAAVPGGSANGQSGSTGIWKSTDGGTTWTNTTSSIDANGRWDVAMDPSNAQRLLATLTGTTAKNGVYVSTNGGGAWTQVSGGAPVGTVANNARVVFAPSNALIVYASFADANNNLLGIWKSSDGGSTWARLSNVPEYLNGGGTYDLSLAVNPSNASVVYAGGNTKILQSQDGGQNWMDITVGAGGTNGTGIIHEAEAFDASGRMLDANGNGIFRLDNATAGAISWSDLNGNLNIAQFLSIAVDPTTTDKIFATGQDNGIAQYSGTTSWSKPDTGTDGGLVRISLQNSNRVYRQLPNTDTTAGNVLRRSDDGGVTWTSDAGGIYSIDPQQIYAPIAIDPNNGNHLLYGTSRVYESFDGGGTWNPISTPFLNGWTLGVAGTITNLAFAPSDPNTIYASGGGNIFVTTNDGASWTLLAPGNSPIGQIVVDPQNSKIVYDVSNGFGTNKVMRLISGASAWQNLTGNLPDLPTYTLAFNGSTMYVGNDNGVYVSTDDGTTWNRMATGMPNVQVRDLEFDPVRQVLTAATFGRGVWQISTATPTPLTVTTTADVVDPNDGVLSLREAIATSNSTGQSIGFDPSLSGGTITLNPANGPLVISKSVSLLGPGAASLSINGSTGALVEVSGGVNAQFFGLTLSGSGTALQIDATGQATLVGSAPGNVGITDNGTLAFDQLADGSTGANISGTGSLLKNGAFTLTLTGSTSMTGGTTVRSGTLKGSTNALQRNISVTAGAVVMFDESSLSGSSGTFGGTVSGTGTLRIASSSTVTMGTFGSGTASTFTNTGPTFIEAGATLIVGATNDLGAASNYTVDGDLDLGGFSQAIGSISGATTGAIFNRSTQANLTATLKVTQNSTLTYAGVLRDVPSGSGASGVLALSKAGSAILTLSGTSTYTGGTTITGGTITGNSLTVEGAYSSSGVLNVDQSIGGVNDGTLNINLSGTGTFNLVSGIARLGTGSTLTNSGPTTVSGTLIGPGTSGTNAFSATSSNYTINGTLDLGGFNQTVLNVSGAGTITNSRSGLATLTINAGSNNVTFVGTITDHPTSGGGTVAINKPGLGTLSLQGANTFSGGITTGATTLNIGPSEGNPLGTGPLNSTNGGTWNLLGRMTTPIQQSLALTGFNQDVIVEASATDAMTATTGSFDLNNANGNNVWYEAGFGGSYAQGTGLPPSGSTITSPVNPAVNFALQPYNANNVAWMGQVNDTVTLQLASPGSFQTLNLLAAAASGNANVTARLNFADGSSTNVSLALPDWFNGANPVLSAGGRIVRSNGTLITLAPTNPRMYEFDLRLTPADQIKVLNSITFTETSGFTSGVYAISGAKWSALSTQAYGNNLVLSSNVTFNASLSPNVTFGNVTVGSNGATIGIPGVASTASTLSLTGASLSGDIAFSPGPRVTLTVGPITDTGAHTVSFSGDATSVTHLSSDNGYGGSTQVYGGTVSFDAGGGMSASVLYIYGGRVILQPQATPFSYNLTTFQVRPGATFDIGNSKVFMTFDTNLGGPLYDYVRRAIINGYDGGKWDGQGPVLDNTLGAIISTSAAQDVTQKHGVGSGDGFGDNNFLPTNTLEFAYALYGDATLDGVVDQVDVDRFHQNDGSTQGTWGTCDFNYDGVVDINDYTLLRRNDPAVPAPQVPFAMIGDVNAGDMDSAPSNPAIMNGRVYFGANVGAHGRELWSTDGTAAGTSVVNNLGGLGNSSPRNLTVVGNLLFYVEDVAAPALWVTDGTSSNFTELKFVNTIQPRTLETVAAGGKLLFNADNNSVTSGLWVSDGTVGGTQLISPDSVTLAAQLTVVGTTTYFANGSQLWKSDGTAAGTVMVHDFTGVSAIRLGATATSLFIGVQNGGASLWTSDATEPGTVQVASLPSLPASMTAVGNTLFFVDGDDSSSQNALWKSDGTAAGTAIVPGTHAMQPANLAVVGGIVYFQNGVGPTHILKTDGTTTVDVAQINGLLSPFTVVGARLYFTVGGPNVSGAPMQLWFTDGTAAGTQQVTLPGAGAKSVVPLIGIGGNLLFANDDLVHGSEPWLTDGTTAGTKMLADLDTVDPSSSPDQFTTSGPWVYFAAQDDANGRQLWKMSPANTDVTRVTSINGTYGADPHNLTDYKRILYFTASYYPDPNSPTASTRLWRTDGTAAGTYIVVDANGHQLDSPSGLLVRDGYLFFVANDSAQGGQRSIYRTDGSGVGTAAYATVPAAAGGLLTVAGADNLLLDVNAEIYRVQPGQTIDLGHGATAPGSDTNVHEAYLGMKLLYTYLNPAGSLDLYSTDGSAPAQLIKQLPGYRYLTMSPNGHDTFVAANGLVFFEAAGSFGPDLLESDGTAAGTTVLKNLVSFEDGPLHLGSFNNAVYFVKGEPSNPNYSDLWKSDGTQAGTVLVSGPYTYMPVVPQDFLPTPYGLYFTANNTLYVTDGTSAGTTLAQEAWYNAPVNVASVGGTLYVAADDRVHGVEPWALNFTDKIVIQNGTPLSLVRDSDPNYFDWSMGIYGGKIAVNDPRGVTIVGDGGNDAITLDFSAGIPLPNLVHLNGTFTINGLGSGGANPFAGTTLEIGQSTLYFSYAPGQSSAPLIRQYLTSGYAGGAWNGTSAAGAINSALAAGGPAGLYGIGYADSADGIVSGQPANTVEVRYTVNGDANLDATVDSTDGILLARNYGLASDWDRGNFNYDGSINYADALILQKNFNKTSVIAGWSAAGTSSGAAPATTVSAPTASASQPPAPAPSTADPANSSSLATTGSSQLTTMVPEAEQTKQKHHWPAHGKKRR
jgi:ELWxxDGT repeat protein/autotransporter-associated beta strand protein